MTDLQLSKLSAIDLKAGYSKGSFSPVDVVANSLNRIAEVNPALNAFCFIYGDEAMDQARDAELKIKQNNNVRPLEGVPIAIKDFTPIKGKRTTLGSKVYENWIPDYDVPVVERLRSAGAIILGKTTTPEFASSSFTTSSLWGTTKNPWNLEHTPGGSSGGSAAAVVSGCVPIAEGSDGGGSIRIPAALSGCVGLKPSLGRIPSCLLPTSFETIFHHGPLARTVDDAALFLRVTQGPDDRDIMSNTTKLDIPESIPAEITGMKLAVSYDLGFFEVDDEVIKNTMNAVELLRNLGAEVTEVDLPWTNRLPDEFFSYWSVLMIASYGHLVSEWKDQMDDDFIHFVTKASGMTAAEFKKIEIYRTSIWEDLRLVFAKYDALVCPTMALPAPVATMREMDFGATLPSGKYQGLDMCFPFNFTSQCPAISVPSGFTKAMLPTGLQFVGRRFDELTVLKLAAAIQTQGLHQPQLPSI